MPLPETQLLQYIHKTADMGCEGIMTVLDRAGRGPLHKALSGQLREYQNLRRQAAGLLQDRQEIPASAGRFVKVSTGAMSMGKLFLNDSPSKIAEMTIQGNSAGVCKTLQRIRDYGGDDVEVLALARQLLATEEANVEELKSFL